MAATLTEFYFDGLNLALSSCVFTDAALTTVAPQGWYSDGSATRFLTVTGVNGSLGVDTNCPSCNSDCEAPAIININTALPAITNFSGTFLVPLGLGIGPATQGAIIIRAYYKPPSGTSNSYPLGLLAYRETQTTTNYTTNNFTASGTGAPNSVPGEVVNWAGTDGGSVRKINDTPLTDATLPVWVGSQNVNAQDATAACAAGIPQLPQNTPFTGTGGAAPISAVGLPHYTFQYGIPGGSADAFVLTSPAISPNIDVEVQQVQVGPSISAGSNGYRGWLTTVIPKDNNIQDTAYLQIQNVLCNGAASVVMGCAVDLQPINCSSPFSNQSDACGANVNSGFQLFNVPGAADSISSSGSPNDVYGFGLPNLFDLVCSTAQGNDLADNLKDKWYKYNNSQGEPRLFHVDEYSVIDQTDVVCVINDMPLDTPFSFSETEIGGGRFRAQAQIDAGVTGAVIVRAFTGNVAVGLFVNHTDSTGNPSTGFINSRNLFSVRGSSNLDGNLMQTEYVLNSDDTNVEALTGYNTAGVSVNLNSFNSITESVQFTDDNGDIIKQWLVYDYVNPCDSLNQLPCYVYNGNPTEGFFIDAPVYIGKAGESTAAIPCTSLQSNTGGNTFSGAVGPQIDCTAGFNPPNLGSVNTNIDGFINLPSNGNHLYGAGELAPPVFLGNTEAEVFDITTGQSNGVYEIFKYPQDTTSCAECDYTFRILDGDTGNYINTSTFSSLYISNRQVQLYSTPNEDKSPGWSMAVLPKTSANIEKILLDVYSVTSNTSFIGYISCAALSSFTAYAATSAELVTWCTAGASTGAALTVYVAHNAYGGETGPCIPGATGATGTPCQGSAIVAVNKPYLNDMVFTDANGATKLPQGLYWYTLGVGAHFSMSVDAYGVVTCIRNCTGSPNNCS